MGDSIKEIIWTQSLNGSSTATYFEEKEPQPELGLFPLLVKKIQWEKVKERKKEKKKHHLHHLGWQLPKAKLN